MGVQIDDPLEGLAERQHQSLIIVLLFLVLPLVAHIQTGHAEDQRSPNQSKELSSSPPPLPHLQRGNAISTQYRAYAERMATFYEKLRDRLSQEAPDLLTKLPKGPPNPVPYGYQIIPKLVPFKPPSKPYPRVTSTRYSWPITERMINGDSVKLDTLEQQLEAIAIQRMSAQHSQYDQVAQQYTKLEKNRRLIDRHIKHNNFWQNGIHQDKARYDRQTALHDAVVERQAMRESLKPSLTPEQAKPLKERERTLTLYITNHRNTAPPASLISLHHPTPHLWILRVPLFTDIQDSRFLQGCKAAIEKRWHVIDGDDEFRVEVLLTTLNPLDLYDPDPPPAHGTHIDLRAHMAKFPPEGGVLTTGAKSTHAMPRRSIALGPQNISTNTMAHEFGHILGFDDRYFRGYRDLGSDGYEVLEVVPDYEDIMAAPGFGQVLRSHFELILAGLPSKTPVGSPLLP